MIGFAQVVPDLVAETRSPRDSDRDVAGKIALWLSYGVSTVWEVDPAKRTMTVHRQSELPLALSEEDTLSEQDLLPGWSALVREIFD